MLFTFVQIFYWLALATWFGAVLFVTMAPPIILRTVRESNPILPGVLSVNLDGQHGTLLSQSIVARLMGPLHRIEVACAIALLVTIVGQWLILRPTGVQVTDPAIRSVLFAAAAGFLVYDWRFVWPRMWKHRQLYLDNADNPDVANPALDRFDRSQRESLTILFITFALLLALIVCSVNIRVPAALLPPA